jgi:hypothetical protein
VTDQRTLSSEQILSWIDETFELVVYPQGFADCIVGVAEKYGGPPVAVLDIEKMLTKLEEQGLTHEEAIEYFEHNIFKAFVGEQTPVYMHIPNFRIEKKEGTTEV